MKTFSGNDLTLENLKGECSPLPGFHHFRSVEMIMQGESKGKLFFMGTEGDNLVAMGYEGSSRTFEITQKFLEDVKSVTFIIA